MTCIALPQVGVVSYAFLPCPTWFPWGYGLCQSIACLWRGCFNPVCTFQSNCFDRTVQTIISFTAANVEYLILPPSDCPCYACCFSLFTLGPLRSVGPERLRFPNMWLGVRWWLFGFYQGISSTGTAEVFPVSGMFHSWMEALHTKMTSTCEGWYGWKVEVYFCKVTWDCMPYTMPCTGYCSSLCSLFYILHTIPIQIGLKTGPNCLKTGQNWSLTGLQIDWARLVLRPCWTDSDWSRAVQFQFSCLVMKYRPVSVPVFPKKAKKTELDQTLKH